MLIGDALNTDEDQLLTQILGSVKIKRPDDIYILNITNNDKPLIESKIKQIKPKIILLAGESAVKTMLNSDEAISKIRGKWQKLEGSDIHVMPIYAPSYLLLSPLKTTGSPKWLTWQDMQEVKNALQYLGQIEKLTKN